MQNKAQGRALIPNSRSVSQKKQISYPITVLAVFYSLRVKPGTHPWLQLFLRVSLAIPSLERLSHVQGPLPSEEEHRRQDK